MAFAIKGLLKNREVRIVIGMGIFYACLSFAYSFIGFIHYEPGSHYHEYSASKLLIEIGGHLLFGFVAAIPFLDWRLMLMTSGFAILIDVDHLLSALDFSVSGRPDHSILYAVVSTMFIIYLSSRLDISKKVKVKLGFVGAVTLLSHLAYDVFASPGTSFQLFIPFSFQNISFGFNSWMYFEISGVIIALCGLILSRELVGAKIRKSLPL